MGSAHNNIQPQLVLSPEMILHFNGLLFYYHCHLPYCTYDLATYFAYLLTSARLKFINNNNALAAVLLIYNNSYGNISE